MLGRLLLDEDIIKTRKREHSRKPDELYDIIEACSPGPRLELFSRGRRKGWQSWGNQADDYFPDWTTYSNHSQSDKIVGRKKRKTTEVLAGE